MSKKVTHKLGVNGPHIQVKCLFKALIFGTFRKNIYIYSHMRFNLYILHSLTAIGLKSSKSPLFGSLGISETLR